MTRPARARTGLLLAPGAGADASQPALVAIDDALRGTGTVVVRMDFPYRLAGRRAPDRAPVLMDALRSEAVRLGRRVDRLFLGGRSMGGRIASMVVADGLGATDAVEVAGLVAVSYPLHPPGRPERLRTEHLPQLDVPCLFVSGTRDAFATPGELEAAVAAVPGPVTLRWVEGGDHGLRRRDADVAAIVAGWMAGLPA